MQSPRCPSCNKNGAVILLRTRIWDRLWGCLNCMKMFIVEIKQENKSKAWEKENDDSEDFA